MIAYEENHVARSLKEDHACERKTTYGEITLLEDCEKITRVGEKQCIGKITLLEDCEKTTHEEYHITRIL